MPRLFAAVLTMATLLASVDGIAAAELDLQWPQWRGPNRDGLINSAAWPQAVSGSSLQSSWRVDLGPSYSSPIVAADRVFVTETRDRKFEVVRALDRSTGQQIWAVQWEGAMSVPFFAKSNGDWIRSTPAYDGQNLYVAGMRDVLVCLRASDGKEVWRLNFAERLGTPLPQFGFASSPLVVGQFVYVQAGASFVKLNKQTGDIVWLALQDGGGMYGSAFSSPTHATLCGKPQLVVQTRSSLAGVDDATGKVLWSQEIPAFRGMNILTPTIIGNRVFTSSYGGKTLMYEVSESNGQFQIRELWSNKLQGYMSSPVVVNGHIYLHLRNQRFACVEAASGKITWTSKPYGKYWSLIASGDQILALDQKGELLLIRANPQDFEIVDRRTVSDEETWAHLAISGNEVFIRDLAGLTAHRWE